MLTGEHVPKNTELRGGLRWRLSKQVDSPYGPITAAVALATFFLAGLNYQTAFRIPVVMILGVSASFVLLILGTALSALLYVFSGMTAPIHFFAGMLPAGPVALKAIIGLLLFQILVMSLVWRLRREGVISYGVALLRTTVYALIGATVGTFVFALL